MTSLSEAVSMSLAVEREIVEDEEEETHEHVWSSDEIVCRSCGVNDGVSYPYVERGTTYATVYRTKYGVKTDWVDSSADDTDSDGPYECQGCSESDYDLDELFITEETWHERHDCSEEGCECREC